MKLTQIIVLIANGVVTLIVAYASVLSQDVGTILPTIFIIAGMWLIFIGVVLSDTTIRRLAWEEYFDDLPWYNEKHEYGEKE